VKESLPWFGRELRIAKAMENWKKLAIRAAGFGAGFALLSSVILGAVLLVELKHFPHLIPGQGLGKLT
jgi:hypothetical protein